VAASSHFDSLRRLGAAVVVLARIKLELLALGWQEEKSRVAQVLVFAILGSLLAGFALLALAVTITVSLWDTPYRMLALIISTALLGAGTLASIWRVVALLRAPSPLLATTVSELRRDEAALRGDGEPR
jgi:uncharacterized membrane protein YqjE